MNKKNFDPTMYCSAMCYYLDHIKLDLLLDRLEFLRDCADHISAMMSGYITKGKDYKGDWGKFKKSCYASKDALKLLHANKWSTRKIAVTMEHIVPIDVIGDALQRQQREMNRPLTCDEILKVLQDLLIPCLITRDEDKSLKPYKHSMPSGWQYGSDQWDRYKSTPSTSNPAQNLFSDIVAIAPPNWMAKSGFPAAPPIAIAPLWEVPTIPTCPCDCLNSRL